MRCGTAATHATTRLMQALPTRPRHNAGPQTNAWKWPIRHFASASIRHNAIACACHALRTRFIYQSGTLSSEYPGWARNAFHNKNPAYAPGTHASDPITSNAMPTLRYVSDCVANPAPMHSRTKPPTNNVTVAIMVRFCGVSARRQQRGEHTQRTSSTFFLIFLGVQPGK